MILHLLVEFAGYLLVFFYVKKHYFYEKSNQILAILKIKNYFCNIELRVSWKMMQNLLTITIVKLSSGIKDKFIAVTSNCTFDSN